MHPIPVIFEPIFKPKVWGGRRLATLLNKSLPPEQPIGESWELISLPTDESRVRAGPLAGRTLGELVALWGSRLCRRADLIDGRFPLLVKFLDARERLSVQVHPKPDSAAPGRASPGRKDEAWYILHADPGAELYVGLRPGVSIAELTRAANTPAMSELLCRWPAVAGECYFLPSGVVHALGAGIVVAEIQTPSDVTYRLYDWDRVDAEGRSRELHIMEGLRNAWADVGRELIAQPARTFEFPGGQAWRIAICESFVLDRIELGPGTHGAWPTTTMAVYVVVAGSGALTWGRYRLGFAKGDVVLAPIGAGVAAGVETVGGCALVRATLS